MIQFRILVSFLLLFSGLASFSQGLEFTENKGQWDSRVKMKTDMSNGALFLEAQGYMVAQHNADDLKRITTQLHGIDLGTSSIASKSIKPGDDDNLILHSHAYRVQFANSNLNPQIIKEKPQPGTNNFYLGNDPSKWGSDCKIYGAAVYKNVYPGVDVRYYGDNGRLKYDILVQPNADLSKLALDYTGVENMEIKNGDLYIKTSVATTRELYPYTYQIVNGQRQQIGCRYKLYNHTVRFDLDKYDRSAPLVIDPVPIFTTFTGSRADNWGYTATYGPGGVGYAGGIVFGTGYPTSTGAYQTNYGGGGVSPENSGSGFDIGIIKLSADGSQRLYATYVGGQGNEAPHSMIADAQGNLVVAGRTTSSTFPGTKIGPGGNWDIVVFKLSATGNALIGSLIVGGDGNDGVNIRNKYPAPARESLMQYYGDDSRSEVIVDNAGNILLASCTQSSNFPVTTGSAFQPVKSGEQDALFLKFTPNLTGLTYGTFFGGTKNDAGYVLGVSPETGNIYMGGGTESDDIPGNKTGTVGPNLHGSTASGDIDGYVTEFGVDGNVIRSTYIGTGGVDQVYGLKFDRYGFPYVMGTTLGNFPIINAAFSQPGSKQFIAKLQKDLSGYVYSTIFGTNSSTPNISPIAFLVDRCQNVYISGWGGPINTSAAFLVAGTAGMSTTAGAIKTTTDGRDFYFFVLQRDATAQLYGSFFGQNNGFTDHVDGGTSRFDENGVIYQGVCANCGRDVPFPTSPGAWAPTNGSSVCNEAITKIAFDLAGVNSGVKSSIRAVDGDTSDCVPVTVKFRDTVAVAQSYEWNFGDGSPSVRTVVADISHIYTQVGTYRVMLVAVDSTKCYPRDTTYTNIRVREDYATVKASAGKLPPCTSTNYQFNNLSVPYTGKPFKANSFRWIWGDNTPSVVAGTAPVTHLYPGYGTYNAKLVLEDTNYCNAPDTFPISVRIAPNVRASTSTPLYGCAPYNAVFNNTSLGGTDFDWDFGDGTTSTEISPTHLFATPGVYRVRLVALDTTTCNRIDTAYFNITVSGSPTAAFVYTPNPPQENTISVFTNLSQDAVRYRWYYGDGDSLYTYRRDTTVRHIYNETRRYVPCLVAINQYNCPDTACTNLDAIIVPLLDVPNAFTPNGDGVNDRAVVIGYGITKLTFRIYNRWGQLVFETNDRKLGWDGRFNGKAQPMDVYAYTLEAEFFDGKKARKQGDITLLR